MFHVRREDLIGGLSFVVRSNRTNLCVDGIRTREKAKSFVKFFSRSKDRQNMIRASEEIDR